MFVRNSQNQYHTKRMTAYSTYSDQQLVALLKASDEQAYTEIYHRFKGVLYGHAYNKLRNREEVTDLLQELFSQLWQNRYQLDIKSTLPAYLYGMVRNQIFKLIRSKSINSRYYGSILQSINTGICETDHLVREKQLTTIIEEAIDQLPEKMREVFILSRKMHKSHQQIAEELDLAESTVKKQVQNALKILRHKLGLILWIIMLIRY